MDPNNSTFENVVAESMQELIAYKVITDAQKCEKKNWHDPMGFANAISDIVNESCAAIIEHIKKIPYSIITIDYIIDKDTVNAVLSKYLEGYTNEFDIMVSLGVDTDGDLNVGISYYYKGTQLSPHVTTEIDNTIKCDDPPHIPSTLQVLQAAITTDSASPTVTVRISPESNDATLLNICDCDAVSEDD